VVLPKALTSNLGATVSFNQEFIDKDFRVNRPRALSMTSTTELTVNRHSLLLPESVVAGKRVLDLGSFIGQTGDWCLNKGAKSYTGVEINPDFYATSIELLERYHRGQSWSVINQSLEQYFSEHVDQFDIVFCWGVMHALVDHTWALKQMAQRANRVIVQGRHPKTMWNNVANSIDDDFWKELEYNIPYQEWHNGQSQTVIYSDNSSVRVTASNTSLAAVRLIMNLEGFDIDTSVYEQLKTLHPVDFGMHREINKIGYWVADFTRTATHSTPVILRQVYEQRDQGLKFDTVSWTQP